MKTLPGPSSMHTLWEVFSAWMRKSRDVSSESLTRYFAQVLAFAKGAGLLFLLGFALAAGTSGGAAGMEQFMPLLLSGVAAGLGGLGRVLKRGWLRTSGFYGAAVLLLIFLLSLAGQAQSVFGLGLFLLVGLPLVGCVGLLLPAHLALDLLHAALPGGQAAITRALQVVISVFFALFSLSVVLMVFPPKNAMAFVLILPVVMVLSLGAGFGLIRMNADRFLRAPVLFAALIVVIVAAGVMSMPNLRGRLSKLTRNLDRALADGLRKLVPDSPDDLVFVTREGEAILWYAVRDGGGYELYESSGEGPFFTPDGRKLRKAETEEERREIRRWVTLEGARIQAGIEAEKAERLARERAREEARIQEERESRDLALRLERERSETALKLEQLRMEDQQKRESARLEAERIRAEEEFRQQEEKRLRSYLSGHRPPADASIALVVAGPDAAGLPELSAQISDGLRDDGVRVADRLFSNAFIREGGFDRFVEGKGGADLAKLGLPASIQQILLLKMETLDIQASGTVRGLFHASVKGELVRVRTEDGSVDATLNLRVTAPGVTEAAARTELYRRLQKEISNRLP